MAPVVKELRKYLPALGITVRSGLPRRVLDTHLGELSRHIDRSLDVGMRMSSAIDVEVEASFRAYSRFHGDWSNRVTAEAEQLTALQPDVILADVPYLTMAAAARAGIPGLAMSSLNWGDIFQHYCGHFPGAGDIHAQIMDAYGQGQVFLQLAPHMPMHDPPPLRSLGPVAALGRDRRTELDHRFNISPSERLVLIGLGGIATPLPVESWPSLPHVRWVVPEDWKVSRNGFLSITELRMPFIDVLRSCDAVITKPGYGTFAEAACNGVPALYVERGDWPEEPYLTKWLSQNGIAGKIERQALECGDLKEHLEFLFNRDRPAPAAMTGAGEAAEVIAGHLHV